MFDREVPGQNSSLRVVQVTTVPESLWAFFRGQMRYLVAMGVEVQCVSSPGALLGRFGQQEGVATDAIRMVRGISPVRDLISISRLVRYLQALKPDIVHAHTPKAGFIAMVAAWIARMPVRIYHLHGLRYQTSRGTKRLLLMLTEWLTCKLASQVLCVSPSVRAAVVEDGLCAPAKISMLANGSINGVDAAHDFNPERFGAATKLRIRAELGISPDSFVIGFVGRLTVDKGIEDLASAWSILRSREPGARLLLVGSSEDPDRISFGVEQLLANDARVIMTGEVLAVAQFYAAMDVLVLPSHREGFPIVALEAAAMMLPVIGTRVTGCVDAVMDGGTGTVIEPKDPEALAEAVMNYRSDPELRRCHGEAARKWVQARFEPRRIWMALDAEYRRLVTESAVPRHRPSVPAPTSAAWLECSESEKSKAGGAPGG